MPRTGSRGTAASRAGTRRPAAGAVLGVPSESGGGPWRGAGGGQPRGGEGWGRRRSPRGRDLLTFFLRTWVLESPRREGEVHFGARHARTAGHRHNPHPDPAPAPGCRDPLPARHLNLPPGLAGGAGKHGGQVDAAHDAPETLQLGVPPVPPPSSQARVPALSAFIPRALANREPALAPRSQSARGRGPAGDSTAARPSWAAPGPLRARVTGRADPGPAAPPPLINRRGGLLAGGGRTMEVPGRATGAEAPWKQLSAEVSGLPGEPRGAEVRCASSSGAQAGVEPALSSARGAPACLLRRLQRPNPGCFWPRAGFGEPGFKGRENRSCARIHREGHGSRPDPRVPHADGPPCRWRTGRMQKGCCFLTVILGLETTQAEHTL